jgi:hypothetical protein
MNPTNESLTNEEILPITERCQRNKIGFQHYQKSGFPHVAARICPCSDSPESQAQRLLHCSSYEVLETENIFVNEKQEISRMGYGIAWLLGVPVSVLVLWFLITHL